MHMTTTFVALAVALQIPLAAVAAEKARPDPAIEKVAGQYLKAVLAGDAAGVAATYRSDAVEMPPSQPLLKSRPAIEQYYRGLFAGPVRITEFTFSHIETVSSGDVGYTAGTYKQKLQLKSGEPIDDSGNFVVIVKREGGAWKAAYVIHNSDRPAPTPCAPASALILPVAPFIDYYSALFSVWLVRLEWLLLWSAWAIGMVWLISAVLFKSGSARALTFRRAQARS